MPRAAFILLALASLAVAGYAFFAYLALPLGQLVHPAMRAAFRANRLAIYAHIFPSAIALAVGPFQFLPSLRAARPALHRTLGRVYLLAVLIGGLSAAYASLHAFGGIPARTGFLLGAALWLYTAFRPYRSIRRRDIPAHRRWMVLNFSLTLAAVILRIYLGIGFALRIPFDLFYPVIAWISWVPNLLLALYITRRR